MNAPGRFSLKSQTEENPSIPAFFLALSGTKIADGDAPIAAPRRFSSADLEEAWLQRGMPTRHPRFHSTVDEGQQYFEETHHVHPPRSSASREGEEEDDEASLQIKADLREHATEMLHFSAYREDLRRRLEWCLMSPLEVSDKLWEVMISSGPLGSSGAISRAKCAAIREAERNAAPATRPSPTESGGVLGHKTQGGPWRDAVAEAERVPMESVLLFRSHHALADGASILAALSDLCDEAEDIRANIKLELKKRQQRGNAGPKRHALRRILSRLARLLRLCLWFFVGTLGALLHVGYLQITTRCNPFDAVRAETARQGAPLTGRSLSWCDAASLADAKAITRVIGEARGLAITVNDLFTSCATAAIARQLRELETVRTATATDARPRARVPRDVNVVVPVHLRGGVILPNESVGNNIGAFVARCPAGMEDEDGGAEPCPTKRLCRVHRSLLYSKQSPAPFVSYYLAKFCSNYLPDCLTKALFQSANANACLGERMFLFRSHVLITAVPHFLSRFYQLCRMCGATTESCISMAWRFNPPSAFCPCHPASLSASWCRATPERCPSL